MSEPLAYLLTWSTYGTWLHGDERGSVQRGRAERGAEVLVPQARLVAFECGELRLAAVTLDERQRAVVASAIRQHVEFRGWLLHALNVRTNHVHVVVARAHIGPERMMSEFKSYATRALRSGKLVSADARVWTRHGSTRYLWDERSVAAAVAYVVEGQDVPR